MKTVRFKDNAAELANPGMGWALHYYDNVPKNYGSRLQPSDLLEDWPGLSFLYLRIPWSYIEPEENQFNWSVLDTPMERFRARGLQACFRLTCSESWCEYATPKWVKESGAKGYRFRPGAGIVKDGPYWEPDFDDPVFLDKLDGFLAAVAARYDGRPDVAFIEVGSFGVWGEGHTWSSTRKAYPDSTIKRHIDLYLKHFKKTPILGMDDFVSRPRPPSVWKDGVNERGFDAVIVPRWLGREFVLRAGLWQRGRKGPEGRLVPLHDAGDRTVRLGTLAVGRDGRTRFVPARIGLPKSASDLGRAEFAVVCSGVRHDFELQPHSFKVRLRYLLPHAYPPQVRPFLHLVDSRTGNEVFVPREEQEDAELTRYMAENGLGLRDDSILVQGGAAAYFHGTMAQAFWRRAMVAVESEHYGSSAARGHWGDGSGFFDAIEDYHASYASIHWWPHEFLAKNRELVRRINLRIGYRFQLQEMSWSTSIPLTGRFSVAWSWRNAGVAPPYSDYYPTVTLKDAAGGIAAVFVDDAANLRDLAVALHSPPTHTFSRRFDLPVNLTAGEYTVFVSVGDRIGRPIAALPLDGDDGARRYRAGACVVRGDYAVRIVRAAIAGSELRLDTVWTVHRGLGKGVRVFFHVNHRGKLAWAGGPKGPRFDRAGPTKVSTTVPLPRLKPGESCTLRAGLWRPDRIGRNDERCLPDAGESDRRVLLGRIVAGPEGTLTFHPAAQSRP
ncbi:MAG: DUF4832 domain-containing protein [Kiritimatiellaeota bacterium]|nr:DUF4832 domain-containing protein [Kiritimatiellota bacterium]